MATHMPIACEPPASVPPIHTHIKKKESQKKSSGQMATEETYLKEPEHI